MSNHLQFLPFQLRTITINRSIKIQVTPFNRDETPIYRHFSAPRLAFKIQMQVRKPHSVQQNVIEFYIVMTMSEADALALEFQNLNSFFL